MNVTTRFTDELVSLEGSIGVRLTPPVIFANRYYPECSSGGAAFGGLNTFSEYPRLGSSVLTASTEHECIVIIHPSG
jgi:hypothetical protein